MITANELAALHAELIGANSGGTICDFIASLSEKSPEDYRHDENENRIVQIGPDRPFDRPAHEHDLSGEMLEAIAQMIRAQAG